MQFPTLFTTTVLALTANAFLVPLEMADKATALTNPTLQAPSQFQSLALDCSTCPVAHRTSSGNAHSWIENGPKTNLELNFTTEGKQLKINGHAFYPPTTMSMLRPVTVRQVLQSTENPSDELFTGPLAISTSLEVVEKQFQEPADKPVTLVELTIQIIGIDNKMINVDSIHVKALKQVGGQVRYPYLPGSFARYVMLTFSDQLLIHTISTGPPIPSSQTTTCTTISCKARAIVVAKIREMRAMAAKAAHKLGAFKNGCMRKFGFRPTTHKPNSGLHLHGGPDKFAGKFPVPESQKKHHGHHHHHAGAYIGKTERIIGKVFVPVMGLLIGMLIAAVAGTLVGRVVVMMWMFARRRAGYKRVDQAVVVEGGEEERLPKYEDSEDEVEVLEKKELLG